MLGCLLRIVLIVLSFTLHLEPWPHGIVLFALLASGCWSLLMGLVERLGSGPRPDTLMDALGFRVRRAE